MINISSPGFKFLLTLVVGLMLALNVSSALKTAKNSEYFKFGIDIAWTIYWTLLMAKLVLHF